MSEFLKVEGQGKIAATFRMFAKKLAGSLIDASGIPGWELQPDGRWRPPVMNVSLTARRWGFSVYRANEDEVSIVPSVISGLSVIGKIPAIGGTALDQTPAPTLALDTDSTAWVAIRVRAIPESEKNGEDNYVIKEGGGIMDGTPSVEIFASEAAMQDAAVTPTVDDESGAATTTGVYIIPLAKQEGGTIRQLGFYGPLGVKMCTSGSLQIESPIYAEATE